MAPSLRRACTTLAAILLAVVAIILHFSPSAAQQDSPASPLPAPSLLAKPTVGAVELSWTEVSGAVRYELISWCDADADFGSSRAFCSGPDCRGQRRRGGRALGRRLRRSALYTHYLVGSRHQLAEYRRRQPDRHDPHTPKLCPAQPTTTARAPSTPPATSVPGPSMRK